MLASRPLLPSVRAASVPGVDPCLGREGRGTCSAQLRVHHHRARALSVHGAATFVCLCLASVLGTFCPWESLLPAPKAGNFHSSLPPAQQVGRQWCFLAEFTLDWPAVLTGVAVRKVLIAWY